METDPAAITTVFVLGVAVLLLFLTLFLIPAFVAYRRRMARRGLLLFLLVLTGWSGVMWLACLFWAISGETEDAVRLRVLQLASLEKINYSGMANNS